jgi:hypothetical protein
LLAELGPDDYLLTGQRVRVNFEPAASRKSNGLIFASVEEGEYRDGKWQRSRVWNGDQTDYGLNLTTSRACCGSAWRLIMGHSSIPSKRGRAGCGGTPAYGGFSLRPQGRARFENCRTAIFGGRSSEAYGP